MTNYADRTKELDKKITICPATQDDIERMWQIDNICFDEDIAFSPDIFFYHILISCDPAFVAKIDDEMIAFVLTSSQDSPETGLIVTIDVLPDYKGIGIGTVLMEKAEKAQQARGAKSMVLQTQVDNKPAINFYTSLGYKNQGVIEDYYADGRDAFLLTKNL